MINGIGICCFTESYENLLMWAHYADFHRGLCVAFDFEGENILNSPPGHKYPDFFLISVIYDDERPLFSIFENNYSDNIKALCTKSKEWEYEDEWRVVIFDYFGLIKYTPQKLTNIYIGCRMPNETVEEVKKIFINREYSPSLYRMSLDPKFFKLNPEKLSY